MSYVSVDDVLVQSAKPYPHIGCLDNLFPLAFSYVKIQLLLELSYSLWDWLNSDIAASFEAVLPFLCK